MKIRSMSLVIVSLSIFAGLSANARSLGIKEGGGDDPTVLGGTYNDLNCRPVDPDEGCSMIVIDYASDRHGTHAGSGLLTGGDVISTYEVFTQPIQLEKDYVLELTIVSSDKSISSWIFLRRAQKIVNVDTGQVLTRTE